MNTLFSLNILLFNSNFFNLIIVVFINSFLFKLKFNNLLNALILFDYNLFQVFLFRHQRTY